MNKTDTNPATSHHDQFVKSVLHRCVDLGWRESFMDNSQNTSRDQIETMEDETNPATSHHDQFVKSVLHRCVDLGWRESHMCEKSGVTKSGWSQIRNGKKSPNMLTMIKILEAIGLEMNFKLIKNEKPDKQHQYISTHEDDDQGFNAGC